MPDINDLAAALVSQFGGVPVVRDLAREFIQFHDVLRTLQNYHVERLVLTTARQGLKVPFLGNVVSIIHLEGAPAAMTPYLYVRLDSGGAEPIPIHSELTLKRNYSEVWLEWPALAGGYAVLLFGLDVQV